MPYRSDAFTAGQYYHIYNRGAGKGKIFYNDGNYEYLQRILSKNSHRYGVAHIAYCLMPNHYHLLLRQDTDESLSKFISVSLNSYVQGLNIQQGRTGTLFEGRFKHKKVDNWDYLLTLCMYIHLNPVKARLVLLPEEWEYSNYREWIGQRNSSLADLTFIQDHFPVGLDYQHCVSDMSEKKSTYENIKEYLFD